MLAMSYSIVCDAGTAHCRRSIPLLEIRHGSNFVHTYAATGSRCSPKHHRQFFLCIHETGCRENKILSTWRSRSGHEAKCRVIATAAASSSGSLPDPAEMTANSEVQPDTQHGGSGNNEDGDGANGGSAGGGGRGDGGDSGRSEDGDGDPKPSVFQLLGAR